MDAYCSVFGTFGGSGSVGWLRMNLEMHLHLNSEFISNKLRTEFALNLACVAPAPFNFEMAYASPPTQSSKVAQLAALFCGDEV